MHLRWLLPVAALTVLAGCGTSVEDPPDTSASESLGEAEAAATRCEPAAGDIINNSPYRILLNGDNLPSGTTIGGLQYRCLNAYESSHSWNNNCTDVDFAWSVNRGQWCKIPGYFPEQQEVTVSSTGGWNCLKWLPPGGDSSGWAPPRPPFTC